MNRAEAIVGQISLTDLERSRLQSHTVAVLNAQDTSSHQRCTGTLIAKNVVLTAAHCIPKTLQDFYVVTSKYEFAVLERKPVVRVIVHENYKSFNVPQFDRPNDDLALVQFAGDLPPAYAPTSWINVFTPATERFWLYVAGYGVSNEALAGTGELRFSKVTIENAILNMNQSFMQGNQADGFGICKGDSGGPAYIKINDEFYVIGIVSAIQNGCTGTSFFNQTLFYKDWIQNNLTNLTISN